MKTNRQKIFVTGGILLIIAVIFNILFFTVPLNRHLSGGSFWLVYGFTMFGIVFTGIISLLSFKHKKLESRIFGITVFKVGFLSLIIQIVIDIIVLIVGNFVAVYFWIPLIAEVLLYGLCGISLIVRKTYNKTIADIQEKEKKKTSLIAEMRIQMQLMESNTKDKPYYKDIVRLNEMFKYADPVSEDSVVELEDEIMQNVKELKSNISLGDSNKVAQLIKTINLLMEERTLRIKNIR